MTKIRSKTPVLAAFIAALSLTLFGCGGGGGSSTVADTAPATGTAYYVDSAVSGIDYVCGSQEGVTGVNGEFTFEVGQSCTFYLGAIPLRDIVADDLQDGSTVQETDVTVARVLQTLDADGDPTNGITISAEVVEALASSGITALPDTEEAYDTMVTTLSDAGVTVTNVEESDAESHLISSIVSGTTLVEVGYDNGPFLSSITFNDDLTSVNWTNQLDNESGTATINLDGNTLTITESTGVMEFTVSIAADGNYLILTDTTDSSVTERLYNNLEDAKSYLIQQVLAGHSVYAALEDGNLVETWTINADLSAGFWDDGTDSGDVDLSLDGNVLTVTSPVDGTEYLTITDITSEYLLITMADNTTLRLYYAANLAQAYLDSLSGSPVTLDITQNMISGQTWYTSDFNQIDFSATDSTLTITSLTNLEENDGSAVLTYSIVAGKLVIEDGNPTITLLSSGNNYYTAELSYSASGETESMTFYTSKAAFEATLYTDLTSTVTAVDASDDSNNSSHAGFELLTLSAVENGSDLVITATANGDILSAMATSASADYEHNMWIEVNDSLEFGFADASRVWCDEDTWAAGVFTGGTPVPTSDYSYSISGNTVTFTISTDHIPLNNGNYLRIIAEIGEDAISSIDEGNDQRIFDRVQVGALWSSSGSVSASNAPTGTWVYSDVGAPFAGLAVIFDDQNYFGTQQALGADGVIGGVEVGTYTLANGVFTDAIPTVNSNAGDTLVCDEIADNGDGTATLTIYDCVTGVLQEEGLLTQIVSTAAHPEAGAWINTDGNVTGDGESAILLVLDGNGNYMETDLNDTYSDFYSVNGSIQNATEFGTYVVNGDATVTVTPAATTDTSAVCTDVDTSGCGTVAGDSNAAAGFSDLANMTLGVDIVGDVLTLTVEGTPISFQKVQ